VTVDTVWVEDANGTRVEAVGQDEAMTICAAISARRAVADPEVGITLHDEDGVVAFGTTTRELGRREEPLAAGERLTVRLSMQNRLRSGRWFVDCGVHDGPHEVVAFRWRARDFIVHGSRPQPGLVAIEHSLEIERGSAREEVSP
jgi:hypothetical protein